VKGWVIPPKGNSAFVACMEKVLDIYKKPYDPDNPVICMDESPKQLIGETRRPIPMVRTGRSQTHLGQIRIWLCTKAWQLA
jgi:hypothetical protein